MGWPCRKCRIARAERKVTRSSVITGLEVTWSLLFSPFDQKANLGSHSLGWPDGSRRSPCTVALCPLPFFYWRALPLGTSRLSFKVKFI